MCERDEAALLRVISELCSSDLVTNATNRTSLVGVCPDMPDEKGQSGATLVALFAQ